MSRHDARQARRLFAAGVAVAVVVAAAASTAAGCAKIDKALGRQWVVVQFVPNTTLSTARRVTAACSHIPSLRPQPVKATSAQTGIVDTATYDATAATNADLARLQMCLARFRSVQGLVPMEPGGG